jgi:hypothetical protein
MRGMSLLCPHAHLSYAAWRLSIFKAFATLCSPRPSFEFDFLRSTSAQFRPSNTARHFRSSTRLKKTGRKHNTITEQDFLGKTLDKTTDTLKNAKSNYRDTSQNAVTTGEEAVTRREQVSTTSSNISGNDGMLDITSDAPSPAAPGAKLLRVKPWSPYSERGREDLKSLVSSLKSLSKNAVKAELGDIPFEKPYIRLSDTLPESPVLRRAKLARIHKKLPDKVEFGRLADNPWARLLAGPIRHCQATGVKIPRGLFVPWGLLRNPYDEQVYLMPNDLAEIEHLRHTPEGLVKMVASSEQVDVAKIARNDEREDVGDPPNPKDSDMRSDRESAVTTKANSE